MCTRCLHSSILCSLILPWSILCIYTTKSTSLSTVYPFFSSPLFSFLYFFYKLWFFWFRFQTFIKTSFFIYPSFNMHVFFINNLKLISDSNPLKSIHLFWPINYLHHQYSFIIFFFSKLFGILKVRIVQLLLCFLRWSFFHQKLFISLLSHLSWLYWLSFNECLYIIVS